MNHPSVKAFITLSRRAQPMMSDGDIALLPKDYYSYSKRIHTEHTFIFDIAALHGGQVAGEISLRIGDSAEQFYLGHIGYHVDPPYRGHGYAAKACLLCAPIFKGFGMRHVVITTDPTNQPSIKTCLRLGCELETTVYVPEQVKRHLEISDVKNRYIWTL